MSVNATIAPAAAAIDDDSESESAAGRTPPKLWQKVWQTIKRWKIQIEPLILILSLCNTAKSVVNPALMEAKMRRVYEAPAGLSPKDEKQFYVNKMVIWDQNYEYVNLPIACIAGIIYGAYTDRNGRKLVLLISMTSVVVDNIFYILIWAKSVDLPLIWIYVDATIVGLMGDYMLFMSCANAYLADNFPNKATLAIRMIIVSIIFSVGSAGGGQIVSTFVALVGELGVMYIVQALLAASFIYAVVFLNNPLPSGIYAEHEENKSMQKIVVEKLFYIIDACKVFIVPREGHRRFMLYACFFANFIDQLVFGEEKSLIGKYTRLHPFDWSTDTFAEYKTIRPLSEIGGMIFGLLVLKAWLKWRDTSMIVLAILSMAGSMLIIGLAQSSLLIFLSLVPGCFHGLLNPLTYTFITSLVTPYEIGQTFAISTIANKAAGLVQNAALQTIFLKTVNWYQGFVWLLMSGITLFSTAVYAAVHVIARRENIGM